MHTYTSVCHRRDWDMNTMHEDLKALEIWQDTWKMSLNPSKCSIIVISNRKKHHPRLCILWADTSSFKFSTITLESNLIASFRGWGGGGGRVGNTVAKANRTLGFFRRNLWFCPKEVKITAYSTLVRPILEYACLGPSQDWPDEHIGRDTKNSSTLLCRKLQQE